MKGGESWWLSALFIRGTMNDKTHKILLEKLDDCADVIYQKVLDNYIDFKAVVEGHPDKLPLFINNEHEFIRDSAKERLKGEVVREHPEIFVQGLYDVAFNTEDYKDIAYNDGMLMMISIALGSMGDQENAVKAVSYMYNMD